MQRGKYLSLATVLCSTALLRCGSDSVVDPGGCDGEVSLTVRFDASTAQGGPAPVFSWTPQCGVFQVEVTGVHFDPSCGNFSDECFGRRVLWGIESRDPDHNHLEPPIRYAQTPAVARTSHRAEALVYDDVFYEVVLTQLQLERKVIRRTAARLEFRTPPRGQNG